MAPVSRRALVGGGAALVAAGAAIDRGAVAVAEAREAQGSAYAFHGVHQAGIATPAQDRLHFAAIDVVTDDRAALVDLLRQWTRAAALMVSGEPVGPALGAPLLPPADTGEALDLPPSGLTVTFGFGPSLFRDHAGRDRFGLAARQPAALRELPHFPGDVLDPARSGGDLCIQACADDPQVAVHAIRNLVRIGMGTVEVRWSQLGFGRTSSTSRTQQTPRNLFGFKDGTSNLVAEDAAGLGEHVWVDDDTWLSGGTYLVARRMGMTIETWDRQTLADQEGFVGRTKGEGAPLSGGSEHTAPVLARLPETSHVRVVHPESHGGRRMLRRGYNYVDGTTPTGGLDAGLFVLAFVRDLATHFVPMMSAMARSDAMMEYVKVTGSAVFAIPAGTAEGEFVGQALFAG